MSTTATPRAKRAPTLTDLKYRVLELENCVIDIDAMSNGTLARIASMAKLALQYMESPKAYQHLGLIADVFEEICVAAETAQGYQQGSVEEVGIAPDANERGLARIRAESSYRTGHDDQIIRTVLERSKAATEAEALTTG
ncbi:hypothetical protein [Roseateles sp.]|uniref:hypothetical protein n=1 Tax=Roseateles sp. TaxID=1971397 RepID=UPI003BACD3FE